ncbi:MULTISPECIES: hypothetical protein [unclassified Mycobacterium]|uniref:hypothetical protein n=1 Tax=unclassified Mycobacterium TaxID=2642494 RepID=UPI0029C7B68C|nr:MULTISPECIES: hypothetical protein [unclassified Mycobacterium]
MSDESSDQPNTPAYGSDPWPNVSLPRGGSNTAPSLDELRSSLPVRPVDAPSHTDSFPDGAELEYERSVISLPFYAKGADRPRTLAEMDVLPFDAYMRILRGAPVRNGIGYRQFEFYIDAWELRARTGPGPETDITFTLSDTVQPKSICVALQQDSDFPAMIIYNAIYDVYMGSERIIEKQPGLGTGIPIYEVPPRNVTVAFEKPFESKVFSFMPGKCDGMRSISLEEFAGGADEVRSIRGL